ncbi:TonB family protein [Chitinibacteraceae bacterium HSL-7]
MPKWTVSLPVALVLALHVALLAMVVAFKDNVPVVAPKVLTYVAMVTAERPQAPASAHSIEQPKPVKEEVAPARAQPRPAPQLERKPLPRPEPRRIEPVAPMPANPAPARAEPQALAPAADPLATAPSATSSESRAAPSSSQQGAPAERAEAPVSAPVFNAAYLNNPPPAFPRRSRLAGESGTVMLNVLVGTDGRAKSVDIAKSSGYGALDQAALDAVRRWRFKPAMKGDAPVEASVRVPVSFELQ